MDPMAKGGIAQEAAKRCRKAEKKGRGRALSESCAPAERDRGYAAGALRKGPPARGKPGKA
ncbi:MAG: hypothetical protein ACUVS1_10860, partial [Actinomycetota bacterium]